MLLEWLLRTSYYENLTNDDCLMAFECYFIDEIQYRSEKFPNGRGGAQPTGNNRNLPVVGGRGVFFEHYYLSIEKSQYLYKICENSFQNENIKRTNEQIIDAHKSTPR